MEKLQSDIEIKICRFKEKYPDEFKKIKEEYESKNKRIGSPFGNKRIQKVLEEGFEKWCKRQPDDTKKNIKRNIKLIILNKKYIPQDIQHVILMTYNEYTKIINGQAISNYLEQKDMKTLFSKIEDFLI